MGGLPGSDSGCNQPAMTDFDPVLARVEAFDREAGGGVTVDKQRGGYTLTLTETDAPIARLKPEGAGDRMRIQYWSSQGRWRDVGDMGGLVLPLDEALETIAKTDIFWTWT